MTREPNSNDDDRSSLFPAPLELTASSDNDDGTMLVPMGKGVHQLMIVGSNNKAVSVLPLFLAHQRNAELAGRFAPGVDDGAGVQKPDDMTAKTGVHSAQPMIMRDEATEAFLANFEVVYPFGPVGSRGASHIHPLTVRPKQDASQVPAPDSDEQKPGQ